MRLTNLSLFIGLLIFSSLTFFADSLDFFDVLSEPFSIFFTLTLVPTVILLFFSEDRFKEWWRFAKWWLALSVVVLVLAPAQGNGIPIDLVLTKERAAWLMGGLFGIISLIVIAIGIGKKK